MAVLHLDSEAKAHRDHVQGGGVADGFKERDPVGLDLVGGDLGELANPQRQRERAQGGGERDEVGQAQKVLAPVV